MRLPVLAAVTASLLLVSCGQRAQSPGHGDGARVPARTAAAAVAPSLAPEHAARLFEERHERMEATGKAMKTIGRALESGSPDLAAIRTAAARIDEIAGRSAGWFPPGTGPSDLPRTRALPAIWEQPEDFAARSRDFSEAARTLRNASEKGDLEASAAAFLRLGRTCGACHDTYRADRHPN